MNGLEALLEGKVLRNRYRIEAVLAQGGMGAIFRAFDPDLARPVALKVISIPKAATEHSANLRKRFVREAKLAAQIHHPNVVQIFDFGTDEELNLDYLVMQLLSGIDLKQYLARHGQPKHENAHKMLLDAARGVAAGHRAQPRRLIHRDIKPANLFLTHDDDTESRVVVLDFGIALPDDDHTVTQFTEHGGALLTRRYAAPEQLNGATLTPACDVFSLGATGFELFTGRQMALGNPPAAGTEHAIREAHAYLSDRASSVPTGIVEILLRSLSLNPEDRFPNANALASALRDAVLTNARVPTTAPIALLRPVPSIPTAAQTIIQPAEASSPHSTSLERTPSPARFIASWVKISARVGLAFITGLLVWWIIGSQPKFKQTASTEDAKGFVDDRDEVPQVPMDTQRDTARDRVKVDSPSAIAAPIVQRVVTDTAVHNVTNTTLQQEPPRRESDNSLRIGEALRGNWRARLYPNAPEPNVDAVLAQALNTFSQYRTAERELILTRPRRPIDERGLLGAWRCRMLLIDGLGWFEYPYMGCRIELSGNRLKFFKASGSVRVIGDIYRDTEDRFVILGRTGINENPRESFTPTRGGTIFTLEQVGRTHLRITFIRKDSTRCCEILDLVR